MKSYMSWAFGVSLVMGTAAGGALSFMPVTAETPPVSYITVSAAPTPSNSLIRIVSTLEHGIVPIGQTRVEIATENIALDAAHPWRLYLDGNLVGTIENGETTYSLPIGVSGPHVITATLSDAQYRDLASASVQVTAAPESPSSSPFNLLWVAPVMGVFLIGVVLLIVIGLRLTRGKNQA
jgi:hypothetical protein